MRSTLFVVLIVSLFLSCDFLGAYGDLEVVNDTNAAYWVYDGDENLGVVEENTTRIFPVTAGCHNIRLEECEIFGEEIYHHIDVSSWSSVSLEID